MGNSPCIELDINTGLPISADLDLGDVDLSMLSAIFPGGVDLQIAGPGIPNPGDVVGKLLGPINAALAPLVPVFNIIDVLFSIKAVLDAVASLDPIKISAALPDLMVKLDKLKMIMPQFSIPILIKSLITILIVYLVGLRAELQAIIDAQARIDLAVTQAQVLGAPLLGEIALCAQGNIRVQLSAMRNNGAPLNRLVAIINRFAKMANLPTIPLLTDLGDDAEQALVPLDETIKALVTLRASIPA